MYLPRHFREDDAAVVRRVMNEHSFAMLVTREGDEPYVSHLPFLHREDGSAHGHLLAHMARGNAQWRHLQAGQEALVVFQGPHAYVSPSWYAEPLRNVPTWNYVVVHARGRATVLEAEELRAALGELVAVNEQRLERPWSMEDLPGEFVDGLLGAIVGIRIEVTRLEGKLKLSQNRSPDDRVRVAERLAGMDDPQSRETAAWMDGLQRRTEG